jgi:hypothetical protein
MFSSFWSRDYSVKKEVRALFVREVASESRTEQLLDHPTLVEDLLTHESDSD